ncbi:hypothetical protein [Pantoea agglomerans]|uniref:hypothetical protein n=1 Tax=Enterobacter agglomerans TaxID=549 RepID=UPI003C7CDF74
MAKIPFTDRELTRAWRSAFDVSKVDLRANPHRLLLFYAIECGLKAAYLKKHSKTIIDAAIAEEFSHDINELCSKLTIRSELMLPNSLRMKHCNIENKQTQRTLEPSDLNQVWRYGGALIGDMNDSVLENKLEQLNEFIKKELNYE